MIVNLDLQYDRDVSNFKNDSKGGIKRSMSDYLKKNNMGSATLMDHRGLRPLMRQDRTGFMLGLKVLVDEEVCYTHLGLIGPTGSGKSASFYIPNLLVLNPKFSAVVTDPKGELYWKTADDLRRRGFEPIRLAPFEKGKPGYDPNAPGYNPLHVANGYAEIKEIAQLFLLNGALTFESAGKSGGGSEWLNMSTPLLTAAFLYEKAINPDNPRISRALDMILRQSMDEMDRLFSRDPLAEREYLLFKQAAGSEKVIANIRVTIATNMQLFFDENAVAFCESSDLFPRDLRGVDENDNVIPNSKPLVVFISVPETKSNYAAPLMAVLYQQLFQRLQDIEEGRGVLFFLDEFANIGIIPIIDTALATARSRRMGIAIGIQGVEQLAQKYGKDKADNILNNLKTKVFLSGLGDVSSTYASKLCGYATILSEGTSKSLFSILPESKRRQMVRREVMTPDEVRMLNKNKVLVIADNLNASLVDKCLWYEHETYRSRVRPGKPNFRVQYQ